MPSTVNNMIDLIGIMPGFALHALTFPFVLFLDHFYATTFLLAITAFFMARRAMAHVQKRCSHGKSRPCANSSSRLRPRWRGTRKSSCV